MMSELEREREILFNNGEKNSWEEYEKMKADQKRGGE
jgi:hypothetical protein